ncbi:hypothetical protein Tco_0482168 [Tanacetum coccineum]
MDDPNISMEEYIRLEKEKAQRYDRTFNWETATYGKVKYCEDENDCFTNFETKFLAIVFDDTLTSDATLSFEPTISPLNENEIYFRISFDESDDEDYMKTDLENDNDKVDMPSFPSPEPTVSYFNNLDYFKDFENEFPAIVYDGALTSKLDFLTEPTVSPQHIDEFNLKDETSLSKCDEEEQDVLYFNDLFPLNVIYADDLKSDKDNNDDEIQSSGDMTPLPPRYQRHPWLRSVNRVHVLDFAGLTKGMRQTLAGRLRMVYIGDEGQDLMSDMKMGLDVVDTLCFHLGGARRRMTWRQFITVLGLHTIKEMAKDGFQVYWLGTFLAEDGHLRRYVEGRKSGAKLSIGHFIGCLVAYFGLVNDKGLRGLSVITRELPMINLHELVRLNICERLGDTWAWVSPGSERQPDVVADTPEAAREAPAVDEGAPADPAPMSAPQLPHAAPKAMP